MTTELLSQLNLKEKDWDLDKLKEFYTTEPLYNNYQKNISEITVDIEMQEFDTFKDFKI